MRKVCKRHLNIKSDAYWTELHSGLTAHYKEDVIRRLAAAVPMPDVETVLDIGCGASKLSTSLAGEWGASSFIRVDYDPKIIKDLKGGANDASHEFYVGDVYSLPLGLRADVIFLLDVLHEVYSFGGRRGQATGVVNHRQGITAVQRYVERASGLLRPSGVIIITDNILCPELVALRVRARRREIAVAVNHFVNHYQSKNIELKWVNESDFMIESRDFCILLSQYNKIAREDWARWEVERLEIHQYMTLNQYRRMFEKFGLQCQYEIQTPLATLAEWQSDFELLEGLREFPKKRVTFFARRP